MNQLFYEKVKILPAITSLILLGISFYMLTYTSLPINFMVVITAGIIGLFLMYGYVGIKKAYSPLKKGSFKVIFLCYISTWLIGLGANLLGSLLHQPIASNPASSEFSKGGLDVILTFLKTGFMLAGEEILTMIPFLLLVRLGIKLKWSKKFVLVSATVLTCIFFGSLHLETYQWNIYQAVVLIGCTRIPFTIASLKLNSIWAGTVTHIAYDWSLFLFIFVTSALS